MSSELELNESEIEIILSNLIQEKKIGALVDQARGIVELVYSKSDQEKNAESLLKWVESSMFSLNNISFPFD